MTLSITLDVAAVGCNDLLGGLLGRLRLPVDKEASLPIEQNHVTRFQRTAVLAVGDYSTVRDLYRILVAGNDGTLTA